MFNTVELPGFMYRHFRRENKKMLQADREVKTHIKAKKNIQKTVTGGRAIPAALFNSHATKSS